MTKLSGVVSYTLKKIWLVFAVVLVSFAVLLSLFRYALPYANDHKHLLQQFVAENYGVELQIGGISATWQAHGPSIVLSDVSLSQAEDAPVRFSVDTVWVDIDFWQSLQDRIIISERFDIQNARLLILPEQIQPGDGNQYPVIDALQDLFLVQLERFTITDGEVVVKTANQEQIYDLDSLFWVNEGERHQGRGNIRLRELANNSASFVAELNGDVGALSGTLYAKAEALDISPWINEWLTTKFPLQESRANLTAWLNIENNQFDQLHVELGQSSLVWDGDSQENWLTEVNSGSIQALPTDQGWGFRVDQLVITQDQQTFVTDLVGKTDSQGNAVINSVKPVPLQPVMSLLPLFTGSEVADSIKRMRPTGELATLQVKWQSQVPSIQAKFLDVAWQASDIVPGLDAIDFDFIWHDSQGRIKTTANNASLDTQTLLGQPIENLSLTSDVYLYFDEDSLQPGWVISAPHTLVNSDMLSFDLHFRHELASQFSQIALSIDEMSVEHVPGLLPAPLIGNATVSYLSRAFSNQGMIDGASLIWSGKSRQFPFAEQQGVFQASVAITDADFLFSSKWPSLTELDMTLLFENSALYLQSPTGRLDEVALKQINAVIPVLSSSSGIAIAASGESTGEQVASLISKSNLTKLGKLLSEDVKVEGDVAANLYLNVPFSGGEVIANGSVQLQQAKVTVSSIDVELDKAIGTLGFANSHIFADNLAANLYSQPVEVSINGQESLQSYDLQVALSGNWQAEKTLSRFDVPLTEVLSGTFDWDADILVSLGQQDMAYQAQVRSDLVGVTSTMPVPLTKTEQQNKPLVVDVSGNKQESSLKLTIGEQTRFDGVLRHKPMAFTQTSLSLGRDSRFVPNADHTVMVSLPVLNLDDWNMLKQTIEQEQNTQIKKRATIMSVPDRVYIESDLVQIGSQLFDNARVSAQQENLHWRVDMTSKQATGLMVIPAQWKTDGVSMFAEKLHLSSTQNKSSIASPETVTGQKKKKFDFPLRFRCDDCRLDDIVVGKVDVELNPSSTGVNIDRLNINHPYASLIATGKWEHSGNGNTILNGQFKSSDFGQWLDSIDMQSGIKDSSADFEFKLGWQGAPTDFDLSTLSGNMDWELSDGYLTQVSDKGSRIFTLFSLDSLVRKLSLDFRDVFAQGFFYDEIDGTLVFENGRATTNDTLVDGGAGEIEIAGFAQLDTEELNYNISFTPNVTGNLPFLVYFLANPPTAIAALALDQMLTSAKVISNINYQVTGTFSDPVVTEVGRDSKDISLPASNPATKPKDAEPLNESELQRVNLNVTDS